MVQAPERLYTVEEFEQLEDSECFELDDGVLREWPVGFNSQEVASNLARLMGNHLEGSSAGRVLPPEVPLRIYPDRPRRVPRADGGFISAARLPLRESPRGSLTVAPELIIESISPGDQTWYMERKVREYFSAGVRLVWVLYPETGTAHVYRSDGTATLLGPDGVLDGEDVIPGFTCPLRDIMLPPSED
jgi:Uma2 family endonuclease